MLATICYEQDREPLFVLVQTEARLLCQRLDLTNLPAVLTEEEAARRAEGSEVFSVLFDRKRKGYFYAGHPVILG